MRIFLLLLACSLVFVACVPAQEKVTTPSLPDLASVLVVEHNILEKKVQLHPGELLQIKPLLRYIGANPRRIGFGYDVFGVQAKVIPATTENSLERLGWGRVQAETFEFPYFGEVRTALLESVFSPGIVDFTYPRELSISFNQLGVYDIAVFAKVHDDISSKFIRVYSSSFQIVVQ